MSCDLRKVKLSDISVGKGSYGIGASAVDYNNDLPTYLRITDIDDFGNIDFENLKSVDDEKSDQYFLEENDIVFARTGASTGRAYFYEKKHGKFVYAGFLIKFSLDPKKVNPKYMKYYAISDTYKNWIKAYTGGSTRGNINAKTYGDMEVLLPDIKRQDYLVKILSSLDDKIELNNKINKNLEELAQTLYKRWFVDFEFPNEDGEPYKSSGGEMVESELGLIPKGWSIEKLKDFAYFQEGPGIRNWQYTEDEDGINFMNIRLIQNNDIILDTASKITKEEAYTRYKHFLLDEWDIVMSTSGTLGRYAIVRKDHLPLCLNTSVIRFRPKEDYDLYSYLFSYLTSYEFYRHLTTKASGSVQLNFGPTHIKKIKFIVPDKNVYFKFNKNVFTLLKRINQVKLENNFLSKTRDTLLPKLMNGEIEVPIEE